MPFRSIFEDHFSDGSSSQDSSPNPDVEATSPYTPLAQPTATEVLYPEMAGARPAQTDADAGDPYVSDSDRNHLRRVVGEYEDAKQSGDPERFRQALTGGIGGTLQSYSHLRRRLPEEAVQAYGDFQRAFDDRERRSFTANGLKSTADDRAVIAHAAAGEVLRALPASSARNQAPMGTWSDVEAPSPAVGSDAPRQPGNFDHHTQQAGSPEPPEANPRSSPLRLIGPAERDPAAINESVTLEFDGKELRAVENGKVFARWPAVSGRPGYQDPKNQGLKDKGPIPEGEWILRQDARQEIGGLSNPQRWFGAVGKGHWPGLERAWGNQRIWLEPAPGTDTLGRTELSIHGGAEPGSAGCIDLTNQMDDFARLFRELGQAVNPRVYYNQ